MSLGTKLITFEAQVQKITSPIKSGLILIKTENYEHNSRGKKSARKDKNVDVLG